MASADSHAQGLAESQALAKQDFTSYEDPARAWIDLVTAFKSGNPDSVRAVLTQAKASHWTHDLWNEAVKEPDNDDDGYPDTDSFDEEWIDEDSRNVKKWQNIAATQDEFWEE